METKKIHNTKYNYDDVFIRNILLGLQSFYRNKIIIQYRSEEQGDYKHIIPFYYKTGADTQFLIDAFIDDIPDKRVQSNTDIIPRAVIEFDSWSFVNEEFANPTVWYTVPEMNDDDELIHFYRQIKWVPITLNGSIEFTVETIFEQFIIWQEFITSLYSYNYFTFEHKYLTIQSHVEYGSSTNNAIPFNKEFAHQDRIVLPFTFTIRTHLPILDTDYRFNNKAADKWIQDIYMDYNSGAGKIQVTFGHGEGCNCGECND